jgi:hypothetical protein
MAGEEAAFEARDEAVVEKGPSAVGVVSTD